MSPAVPPSSSVSSQSLQPHVWKVISVAVMGPLLTSLDATVVNISLATLGHDLKVPLTTLQWVVTGYLLAMALMLPVSGWLVDRIGAKRIYLGCFTAFTLASLWCGMATTAEGLIFARVMQGMAGGLLAPLAQMMVVREAPHHVAKVMGLLAVPILLGPIFGPTVAGLILQHASWRWIFFINLPIGVLAVSLAALVLPADHAGGRRRNFDGIGFVLISPGLALLLHSLEALSAGQVARLPCLIELAAALALLGAFAAHAWRRGTAALIDLHLFRDHIFATASRTQFLTNALAFGGGMMIPLYLLQVQQMTPVHAGMLMASSGMGMMCSYPAMGSITARFGSRHVSVSGALIALVATLPFVFVFIAPLPGWLICVSLFVRGMGQGGIGIPSIAAAYANIDRATLPVATTAINIVQRLGGPVATTLLAIFLHTWMASSLGARGAAAGFAATFGVLIVMHVATVLSATQLPVRVPQRRVESVAVAETALEAAE